jgi:hypothetical protein
MVNGGMNEDIEAVIKEITACQLSSGAYKFECSVCGSRHIPKSKAWKKCLNRYQYRKNPYLSDFYYNPYTGKLNIQHVQTRINILIPGFSVQQLFDQATEITEFLNDYFSIVKEYNSKDKNISENISIEGNQIIYKYVDKLASEFPYIFLFRNYHEYDAAMYEKNYFEKLPVIKSILLDIGQVLTKHSDLFFNNQERIVTTAEASPNVGSYSEQAQYIAQTVSDISIYEVKDFLIDLVASYYRNDITYPFRSTKIDTIKDKKSCTSYSFLGNVYAQTYSDNNRIKNIKLIATANNNSYSERLQNFIIEIMQKLLPTEHLLQYMLESSMKKKKNRHKNNNKGKADDNQLSLDMLASL